MAWSKLVALEAHALTLLQRDIDEWSATGETGFRVVSEHEILSRRSCACGEGATAYNLDFRTMTRTAYCGSCFEWLIPYRAVRGSA